MKYHFYHHTWIQHRSISEYNPFSASSRICIGGPFAIMEIKIVLVMLLMQYRLQYLPQQNIDR
ncbi:MULTISPECIES: cytochrome P450 [unclassified Anabaena]|uniref:cytochrome P450 n=1 Tax=unclassified Anabaena TaxID=2619674 RepID=UPI0039C5B4A8